MSPDNLNPRDREQDKLRKGKDKDNDKDNDNNKDQPVEGPVASGEVDEFFQRLPGNLHWPKPNAEAVAAAVEAIQRLSGGAAAAQDLAQDLSGDGKPEEPGGTCSACGGSLPAGARFCVWCGIPNQSSVSEDPSQFRASVGQHHFHHHYHHFVPGQGVSGQGAAAGARTGEGESSAPRGRAPGSPGTSTGGRAEAGARKIVQDWAQACNTKHIDDLLELYAADATVIRSSVPPIRSLAAIREFLISLLEAGLGDVEMESLRLELMGEIAIDIGRCKMLVPVAMGKRREERGKYLIVLVRQPAGTWKILADCWSSDSSVNVNVSASAAPPEPAARKGSEPIPPPRKFR